MSAIYTDSTFQNGLLTAIALIILAILLGCFYTFVRAIFFFIFSHLKDDNKKKGRNSIRFMIIGVILTIVLILLIPTLMKAMNIPKYEYYYPKNIFNKMGQLINGAFNLGNVIKKSQLDNQYNDQLYYDTSPNGQTDMINSDYQL